MTDQPAPSGIICPVCSVQNAEGVLVCANCGAQLYVGLPSDPYPTPAAMPVKGMRCAVCGWWNGETNAVCDNCGANLRTGEAAKFGTATFPVIRMDDDEVTTDRFTQAHSGIPPLSREEVRALQSAGASRFEEDMVLRLEIEGAPAPILVQPAGEMVLGRRDPVTNSSPEVDFTPYAGYRMGVSRQHATLHLRAHALSISDLGSSNGTFVNGLKLPAHEPHALRDGDEIVLGKMLVRVYFQTGRRKG